MPDERPVDSLRDELRALGYLDARVDRFVLGGVTARRSAAALAAAASARIGVLVAILLGPAAAIGAAARVPGLVTRPADALTLAGYFAVLFGLASAVASFLVILPVGYLARRSAARADFAARARRTTGGAGLLVALACFAYLALWWRATADATLGPAILTTAAVLGVAAAISLLVGHAVAVTALAFVARLGAAPSLGGRRIVPLTVVVPLAIVAVAGASTLLALAAPTRGTPAPPPLTVVTTGAHVTVIAIDGVDLATIDRLRAQGQVPTLDRLLGGASAALASDSDRDPARVWTTIATGRPPAQNGIGALETRQVAGLAGRLHATSGPLAAVAAATDLVRLTHPAIASGEERRVPTFWEVAARAGLRTAVIQWWATWPAGADAGIVVSDRAILRLENGGALDGEVAPPALYDRLRASWPDRRARVRAVTADVAPAGAPPEVAALLRRSAELDATVVDLAADPALGPLDLLVVYLPGLDIAQHALLSGTAALSPSVVSERLAAVEHYYLFLDRLLARFVPQTPDQMVLTLTEPGRVDAPSPGRLAVAGAAAAGAAPPRAASPLSIAATVLYALGIPVASDLGAPALTNLFSPDFLAAHPVRSVSTYGPRHLMAQSGAGRPLDKEMIDRMRSLGYISR